MTTKPKISIRINKEHQKIWHAETGLFFRSKEEKIIVGKIVDNKVIDELDENDVKTCNEYGFKYDETCVKKEVEKENSEEEEGDENAENEEGDEEGEQEDENNENAENDEEDENNENVEEKENADDEKDDNNKKEVLPNPGVKSDLSNSKEFLENIQHLLNKLNHSLEKENEKSKNLEKQFQELQKNQEELMKTNTSQKEELEMLRTKNKKLKDALEKLL